MSQKLLSTALVIFLQFLNKIRKNIMILKNMTGHSVFISDINRSFAPVGEKPNYEISYQDLMKSMSLRNMIRRGAFVPEVWDENNELENQLHKESMESLCNLKSSEREVKKGILLRGQFLDYSGYAKVNRNLAICMAINGLQIKINAVDISSPRLIGSDLVSSSKFTYTPSLSSDVVIDSIVPSSDVSSGKFKSILYTTVEASSIPESFSNIFNKYDEIWTTSNFCKKTIATCYSKKILVVPGIVDFSNYTQCGSKFNLDGQAKSFKFISVFNWNYRKGADALIRAYCKAFTKDDDISLILVCRKKRISGHAIGVRDEVEKEVSRFGYKNAPHIMRVTKEINESQLSELYRSCNAFVLPTRGEGYGLPFFESSLCGLPVIGTNVSAVGDVLNSNNSLLLEIDRLTKVPKNSTGCYFWDNHLMADLTSESFIDSFVAGMRDMVSNYSYYVEKNKVLQREIKLHASSESIWNIIKDSIKC